MFSVRCLFIGNKRNIEHPIPQSGTEHSIGSFLRRNHAAFPRVIEQAAGVHHEEFRLLPHYLQCGQFLGASSRMKAHETSAVWPLL